MESPSRQHLNGEDKNKIKQDKKCPPLNRRAAEFANPKTLVSTFHQNLLVLCCSNTNVGKRFLVEKSKIPSIFLNNDKYQ